MKKKLVFSLENSNIKTNENLLIGSQWVLETNQSNLKDLKYDVFYSQSSKKKQRVRNTFESSKIYEAVLKQLSKKLNSIHNVNLNFKAWKILLGHWVRRFVDLCFQRDNLIKEILKTQEIDQIYGVKSNKYNLHSKDSLSIYYFSRDLLWNNIIIFKLFKFYNYENINLNFQEKNFDINAENLQKEYSSKNYKISFSKKIIFFFFNIFRIFRKNNEALITGSGLPFFHEKLLELLFFQFPKHYENNIIEHSDYNIEKRLRLKFDQAGESNQKNIQNFIMLHIHEFLPSCFLEKFEKLYKECENYYPTNPKFILTGYHHEYNEIFKFYTAKKVNIGTPYFSLQHGNTYFVQDYILNRVEYETSTKFITFGYNKKNFCEPLGNIKTISQNYSFKKNGKLNILAPPIFPMFNSFDYNSGFLKSLEMLKNFKKIVSKEIDKEILLRLHPNFRTQRGVWFQNNYLKDFHKSQIDLGKMNYSDFLKKGRLNLMFYDGSGILENLCNNLPTVAIWTDTNDSLYDHVDDEFIEKYNYLKEAGIIFDNLNQLKNHLEKHWNNIDKWWFSKKTQNSIIQFNKDFNNKTNIFSLIKLKKIINKNI